MAVFQLRRKDFGYFFQFQRHPARKILFTASNIVKQVGGHSLPGPFKRGHNLNDVNKQIQLFYFLNIGPGMEKNSVLYHHRLKKAKKSNMRVYLLWHLK